MNKLVIVAIGGNSLVKDSGSESIQSQQEAVAQTVEHIADMIQEGYKVVVTHGNGPQVGFTL
ncbi:carbamate kinase, partial [Clostridioides difficile]|nr:carbamate kinase [Clostridioides difficile]